MIRVGYGYDSHRFDPRRALILGGIRIPEAPGLSGFSDGDAVAHAVIDAVLGACALGDVGRHFPPGDERWRDADSMDLLQRAITVVHEAGFRVGNVDVTVICERPRISPWSEAMAESLAERLQIDPGRVSIKGKTNEGMGWTGTGEGMAVHAVALVQEPT